MAKLSQDLQDWIDARKRFRLSHAQVQMARELGMNPRKLGKLDNHHQEPWKAPLPQFIEQLYLKRFGRERPEHVMSIEDRAREKRAKQAARKAARGLAVTLIDREQRRRTYMARRPVTGRGVVTFRGAGTVTLDDSSSQRGR
ncbi:MAG: hypothetical protein E6J91_21275 [Deltaproteobacteria bacterium]|nr:MAG: hypothetical protein E6J91_21275 [Deltaproteobacteria bacterium]